MNAIANCCCALFQQIGYFQARVSTELNIDARTRSVNALFHSNLGRKVMFGIIEHASP